MSYILEALKKAQAERQLGAAPTIHAPALQPVHATRTPSRALLWTALSVAGLALAGAAALYLRTPTPADAQAAQAAQAAASAAPPPPGQAASSAALPAASTAPNAAALEPASVPSANTPAASSAAAPDAPSAASPAAPSTAPGVAAVAPAAPPAAPTAASPAPGARAPLPPAPGMRVPPFAGVPEVAPPPPHTGPSRVPRNVTARPAEPARDGAASTAAAPPAPEESLPTLRELPEPVQREIPQVAFGGYIYSKNPADRLLLIDRVLRHEGEEVAPGLMLEKLLPKSAVMNYKGYRYRIAY